MLFTLHTSNEKVTTTTTDITVGLLLESTIEPLLDSKQKNRRSAIHIKHQERKLENLPPDFLQQCVLSLSRLVADIQMSRYNHTLQVLDKIQEEGTLNIPAISSDPTTSENQGIKIVQNRLIALLQEDEDDYGISKPTSYAFSTAWKLVSDASALMGNSFPKASASTDDEGGIRLTWARLKPEVEVRLVCPSRSDKQMYLYHERSEKYDVVDDVSALTLASWLKWFNKA